MKCDEIEILISAYVDEEVTEEERQVVEEHIRVCEDCQTILTNFIELHTLSQELELKQAPQGFRQRVSQRIDTKPNFVFPWRLPRLVYVLSLSLLILLSTVGLILQHTLWQKTTMDQNWKEQAALGVEVYAEDILFGQSTFDETDIFSEEEVSVAEEILDTIDFIETDTSFFFGDDQLLPDVPGSFKNAAWHVCSGCVDVSMIA